MRVRVPKMAAFIAPYMKIGCLPFGGGARSTENATQNKLAGWPTHLMIIRAARGIHLRCGGRTISIRFDAVSLKPSSARDNIVQQKDFGTPSSQQICELDCN